MAILRRMLEVAPPGVAGTRDRALLTGFAGALRRSEVVALTLSSARNTLIRPSVATPLVEYTGSQRARVVAHRNGGCQHPLWRGLPGTSNPGLRPVPNPGDEALDRRA